MHRIGNLSVGQEIIDQDPSPRTHTHTPLINTASVKPCVCLPPIALLPVCTNYSWTKALDFPAKRTQKPTRCTHACIRTEQCAYSSYYLRFRGVSEAEKCLLTCTSCGSVCTGVCMCMHMCVCVIIDVCCVNMLHPLLYMSVVLKLLRSCFPSPSPQSAFLLTPFLSSCLLPRLSPHWMTHTLPQSIASEAATPPCSSSYFWLFSILYNHPFLPQASNFGRLLHASNYRDGVLYWCQTVSPLSLLYPSFLPFLLWP